MYSSAIRPKVDKMFADLRKKARVIVSESSASDEAIKNVTRLVSSELTSRSKSILSDMLYSLSDSLMESEFFSDIKRQNKFFEINLRQEILSKYQFAPVASVNYKEASKTITALKVGGATFAVGGAVEVGVVLISGLSVSSLVPIPISALVITSIGVAVADYYAIAPARNKRNLAIALDNYLTKMKQQFLKWFDEVEKYFNIRVEEIKRTM